MVIEKAGAYAPAFLFKPSQPLTCHPEPRQQELTGLAAGVRDRHRSALT